MRRNLEGHALTVRKRCSSGDISSAKSRGAESESAPESRSPEPRGIDSLRQSEEEKFSANRSRKPTEENLDGTLSAAIVSQDKELSRILDALDDISATLKSEMPNTEAVSKVLRRAVLCAVRQSLVDRELRSLALTDDLTGLYNRRAFLAIAAQQLKLAQRKQQHMLLFFADMDRLKEINDSCGHREGDLALIRCADALEQTFRHSDVLARIGGDEFAVLVLEASPQDEDLLLQRLERNLARCGAEESRYGLSLSVGVARFDPEKSQSLAELMAQADRSMYGEKRRRPRVVGRA